MYAIEGAALGVFLLVAIVATAVIEIRGRRYARLGRSPASPAS